MKYSVSSVTSCCHRIGLCLESWCLNPGGSEGGVDHSRLCSVCPEVLKFTTGFARVLTANHEWAARAIHAGFLGAAFLR